MRRVILYLTLGAVAGVIITLINPVGSKLIRLGTILSFSGAWMGLLILVWKRKPVRLILLSLPAIAAALILLPAKEIDREKFRADYLDHLTSYENVEYFWGGETSRGIDCSGLPRRAYRDALLSQAISHFNPSLLRTYLSHWWYDASAEAMADSYRDYLRPLDISGDIRTLDYEQLQPGDIAIDEHGVHAIVYLGGDLWIQADPGVEKVITLSGRTDENLWFAIPVRMFRWSGL